MTRRSVASFVLPVLVALGPVILSGCGGGTPYVETSKTEAVVRGKVIVRGKPARGGLIWFDPSNIRRKDAAAIGADVSPEGTYEITTMIGENAVRYEGPAIEGDRELDGMTRGYIVEEGENEFDLVLPAEGSLGSE